jgi:tetratricopeptide (TPR) repeat protein
MRRLALLALVPSIAFAQDHAHQAGGKADRLGSVTFPVSCSATTKPKFERAVAMLHSFWFEQADRAFSEIIASDSTCALAYWGRAMTLMGNPMTRAAASPERQRNGLALATRAKELSANATHREQMYADAALAYYTNHDTKDHLTRMKAHEQAFKAIRDLHGDDMEATIFYARTVVANAAPTDQTFKDQIMAGELLQPLFDKHPDHPGLAHYLIHAYDAPATANRGAKAAQAYAGIAPDAPHALHMPSHIFTRLGYWDESIETNARSARAEPDSNAAVHPMDYMVYAYLQQGRMNAAKGVVSRATEQSDRFYGGTLGYNFAAMPARYALEREMWSEAAMLKAPPATSSPWVRAITHFARGVGAARSGKADQAKVELDTLASLKAALDRANDSYWATIVEAQRLATASWVALAGRDTAGALRLARQAADLEETVEKHPVTPGPILPARELEGDMLLQLGKNADALAAFEKTLVREPRRLRALFGATRAAHRAGNEAKAHPHHMALKDLLSKADRDVAAKYGSVK